MRGAEKKREVCQSKHLLSALPPRLPPLHAAALTVLMEFHSLVYVAPVQTQITSCDQKQSLLQIQQNPVGVSFSFSSKNERFQSNGRAAEQLGIPLQATTTYKLPEYFHLGHLGRKLFLLLSFYRNFTIHEINKMK